MPKGAKSKAKSITVLLHEDHMNVLELFFQFQETDDESEKG